MDHKIPVKVKISGSRCVLEGYVKDNSMQGFILTALTYAEKIKLRHKNEQSQWTVKYRSRALGQGACSKGMSRTITMQGFTLTAITDAEKTKLRRKN